jgi:hypothetical protein
MSFQDGEELVSQDCFDSVECVRVVPSVSFLWECHARGSDKSRCSAHTSHVSRSPSGSSIISRSIGSLMSQSWNAAVSFETVFPSNMCEFLYAKVGDIPRQRSRHSLSLFILVKVTNMQVDIGAVLPPRCDRGTRNWVIRVPKVQPLVADEGVTKCSNR